MLRIFTFVVQTKQSQEEETIGSINKYFLCSPSCQKFANKRRNENTPVVSADT